MRCYIIQDDHARRIEQIPERSVDALLVVIRPFDLELAAALSSLGRGKLAEGGKLVVAGSVQDALRAFEA